MSEGESVPANCPVDEDEDVELSRTAHTVGSRQATDDLDITLHDLSIEHVEGKPSRVGQRLLARCARQRRHRASLRNFGNRLAVRHRARQSPPRHVPVLQRPIEPACLWRLRGQRQAEEQHDAQLFGPCSESTPPPTAYRLPPTAYHLPPSHLPWAARIRACRSPADMSTRDRPS